MKVSKVRTETCTNRKLMKKDLLRHRYINWRIIVASAFLGGLLIYAQSASETNGERLWEDAVVPPEHSGDWRFTTEAYEQEATRVLIAEVNNLAFDLDLPEQRPIASNDILGIHIFPPAMGMLGTLTTSNYTYYVTLGRKFSGMDHRDLVGSFYELKSRYLWPLHLKDTNAVFKEAVAIMAKAGMDVAALNRDCQIEIDVSGPYGSRFVPDYWIKWNQKGRRVGFLEFFAPTRSIRQLHVRNPSYIRRKPAEVPQLGRILREGHAPDFLLKRMGLDGTNQAPNGPSNTTPSMQTTAQMN